MDIAEALARQGLEIDKRKIHLEGPLKVLGEYDVIVKFHPEVAATIKVKVEGEPEAPPAG
jgi:large subunit ribosomal protein L9